MKKKIYLLIAFIGLIFLAYGCNNSPHVHELETFDEVKPTCTTDGHQAYEKCKKCKYTTFKKIPALGHDLILTEAKPCCFEDGYEKYKCLRCNYLETKVLPKVGDHTIECSQSTCPGKWHTVLHNCKYCGKGTTISFKNRYFISKLTDEQQQIFKKIYDSIMNFEESITFNTSKEIVTVDDFKNIYMWLIDYECPELMQINGEWNWNYVVLDGKQCITSLKPGYQMTKIQYQTALLEIGEILFNFKEKLMHKTDYEKELYVHDYIVESVVYDDDSEFSNCPYGVFNKKAARCQGLCKSFMWCMWTLDIDCLCVVGNASGMHSWNIVKIDNVYSYVDLTWDNGLSTDLLTSHYYFNINDELLKKSHILLDAYKKMGIPECTDLSNWYPQKSNEYITSTKEINDVITECVKNMINNNKKAFALVFKNSNILNDFTSNYHTYLDNANVSNNVKYKFKISTRNDLLMVTVTIES